ncbi:MAG: type II toxin-antitoxin system VapC family toxin [Actinophytocola sp.]|uniref:type II toxin-antitoxin system VapC family toxin n=1 Tax=Actinophytocola sp. TaxID=1872138 RepID=UPI00132BA879|nr:type II toxin-antitoxin system VapC family toxin [Actinophytocola sp.]MPZ85306.1 type II toxin-antitoxin system VapC family toxin [Actinophytocola sp.]
MNRVILDTDVASLSFKNRLPASLLARLGHAQFGITFVTLGELTQWATLRDWGPRNRARLAAWITPKAVLPYADDVAQRWGQISGRAIRRGRTRPANDTWIAACCLVFDLPLATLNVKDFADFAEHEGLTIVTA